MVYFFFEVTPVFFNYLNSDGIGESLFAREGEKKTSADIFWYTRFSATIVKNRNINSQKKKKKEGDKK